jgi:hypothetical protein
MKYPPNVTKKAKLWYKRPREYLMMMMLFKDTDIMGHWVDKVCDLRYNQRNSNGCALDAKIRRCELTAGTASIVEAYPDLHRSG